MKNITKLLALVMALAMVLCLAACVSENPNASTDPVGNSAPTDPEPSTVPSDPAPSVSDKKTYKVTLKDSSGNPLSGVMVQICLDSCIPALTDANGVATFELDEESGYSVGVTSDYDNTKVYLEDGQYEVTIVWDAPAAE